MAELQFVDLKTPLGEKLKILSFEGHESVSALFEYSIVAIAKAGELIRFEALLGKPAEVIVNWGRRAQRHYHGIVTAARYEGQEDDDAAYRLTLSPAMWLLTRRAEVRIFSQKTVPEILKAVFEAVGLTVIERLSGSHETREYCVQYRESDFDFASRLMEDEGIFYFFEHAAGQHSLVLADNAGAHTARLGLQSLPFMPSVHVTESVLRWHWAEQIQTARVSLRERSFFAPTSFQSKSASVTRPHGVNQTEVYDAPAGAPGAAIGSEAGTLAGELDAMAHWQIEALQSAYARVEGETDSFRLCTGGRFTLSAHPVSGQNGEYIVLSTRIRIANGGLGTVITRGAEQRCEFVALDARTPFRAPRVTRRPRVAGPQTATVVGPSGEEIHVDKYGRVKLRFHWDRLGGDDGKDVCWVRVAQPAAGKGFGFVFLPRVGQEVVVDFIEGDPDQPLVTGSVYNAREMPPYALPDKKTVSTIKTRSTKGGGNADFNELRFDDLKGSEYLFMQAQKDKLEIVKNTAMTQIGKEQHLIVKDKRLEKVEGDYHLAVIKDHRIKVDGKFSQKVVKDMLLATDGQHSLKAAKDITAEAGTAYSIKAGTDLHIKTGTNVGVQGGVNVHLKGGVNVVIEAGVQLTLKAGSNSVVIGPDGVSITGMPMVKINSGGGAGSGGGASPVAPTAPEAPEAPKVATDPLGSA